MKIKSRILILSLYILKSIIFQSKVMLQFYIMYQLIEKTPQKISPYFVESKDETKKMRLLFEIQLSMVSVNHFLSNLISIYLEKPLF